MSLTTIRQGIQTRLETISGLRVYDRPPDSINELPCAFILPLSGGYHATMRAASIQYEFEVTLLVSRASDMADAQTKIDPYINPTGSKSILYAIEGDATLGSTVDTCWVANFRDYGGLAYAGEVYFGCKFTLMAKVITV